MAKILIFESLEEKPYKVIVVSCKAFMHLIMMTFLNE